MFVNDFDIHINGCFFSGGSLDLNSRLQICELIVTSVEGLKL